MMKHLKPKASRPCGCRKPVRDMSDRELLDTITEASDELKRRKDEGKGHNPDYRPQFT